ncbi:MAG: hypothetical protein JNK37_18105 [Verrucomicrobiales bacterium]|nr:hypothetical protein [Verrucomicrobiales bacterium]
MKLNSPKAFALMVGGVLAIGVGLIVIMFRTGPEPRTEAGKKTPPGAAQTGTPAPTSGTAATTTTGGGAPVQTFTPGGDTAAPAAPAGTLPPVKTVDPAQWEARIEELLANQDITTRDASRELLAMAGEAKGPEPLRIDAVQHGLNLLDDENYLQDALALATNPALPEEINDILFADLHNRDQSISVPVAERIAKTPGHPLAEEAQDFADFFKEDPLSTLPAGSAVPAAPGTPATK